MLARAAIAESSRAYAIDATSAHRFKKKETETAKIVKGDRALADFLSLLFPDDFKIGAVYASEEAVAAAAADKTKGARALIAALNPDGAVSVGGGAKKVKKKSRRKAKNNSFRVRGFIGRARRRRGPEEALVPGARAAGAV